MFSNARLFAPTSVYLEDVGSYIGYPAIIGKNGVEKIVELPLNTEEKEKLRASAEKIKEHIEQLN